MKHINWLICIWVVVFICTYFLLSHEQSQFDTIEELFWAGISVSLTLQVYSSLGNRVLIGAWILYCSGLIFDLLDDLLDAQMFPFLVFDTTFKHVGFLLTCAGLFSLITEKRATIKKLNIEIQTRQTLQEQLEFEASHDKLTALGNRRACFARFDELKEHFHLIYYFDLDNFKFANDNYGHQCGDEILVDFAQRLSQHFTKQNCFRLGGDEFIAFCDDENPNIDELRIYLTAFMQQYKVGVSIGFAELNNDDNPDHLLHIADQNMYRDKTSKSMRQRCRENDS